MKYFNLFTMLFLCSVVLFTACNSEADARKEEARESLNVPESVAVPSTSTPTPPTAEPAQNSAGVWHYTCSAGCAGGAGAAGTCPTCGGALAHNQAYHTPDPNSTPNTSNPATPTPPPPAAEPAQNAAGVWHYTCAKGCAGGAGAAGTCATCGGALTHNQAYH